MINTILMDLPNLLISSFFPWHVSSFLCVFFKRAQIFGTGGEKASEIFWSPISLSLAGRCVFLFKQVWYFRLTQLYRRNALFQVSSRVQLIKQINLTFCVPVKEGFECPIQSQAHIESQRYCNHSGNILFLIWY